MSAVFPSERIEQTILLLRGHKIILDRDLAAMYGVSTRDLNKAVSRNLDRFPNDFMLQLTRSEFNDLKFQFGTSSWGGTRKLPRAFTEQGIAMLSSVLRSKRAIHVNIAIMRAFVKLREFAASHKSLATKLEQLERKVGGHDGQIRSLFDAIRQLMEPPTPKSRRIGFKT
ncbi:MAG: ORF6N domain-containing protein [Nitrospira sp.]|nr:ORF6N domain-containing protein [Nitrospira sp.]TKB73860.1 MAG: ORF6N domain-containing protein [Nitrospira sp.]